MFYQKEKLEAYQNAVKNAENSDEEKLRQEKLQKQFGGKHSADKKERER